MLGIAVEKTLRPPIMPSSVTAAEPSVQDRPATNATGSCLLGLVKVATWRKCVLFGNVNASTSLLLPPTAALRCPHSKRNALAVPSENPTINKAAPKGARPHVLHAKLDVAQPYDIDRRVCK